MLIRLIVVFIVAAVIAAMSAVPAMAQTEQEVRQAAQLLQQAEDAGIAVPSDPAARIQLAAEYGITLSPEVAAIDMAEIKSGNPKAATKDKGDKALPKSGGSNIGTLLGLGAGAALIGGGLVVAHRSARRR